MLPGSWDRGGTWGDGGVKNFSVGNCDGAPSTVRSSLICTMVGQIYPPDLQLNKAK